MAQPWKTLLLALTLLVGLWVTLAACAGNPSAPTASAQQLFARNCARCHGPAGEGGIGPRLIGPGHNLAKFRNGELLFEYIKSSMPQDAPGSLKNDEYYQITLYILRANGYLKVEEMPSPDKLAAISLE
ncbi:MAG: hypothetical protein C4315_05815 [Chloroflexota bacterium]